MYLLATRDLSRAAERFLDAIATFTAYVRVRCVCVCVCVLWVPRAVPAPPRSALCVCGRWRMAMPHGTWRLPHGHA